MSMIRDEAAGGVCVCVCVCVAPLRGHVSVMVNVVKIIQRELLNESDFL